jgi:hypothetical protein
VAEGARLESVYTGNRIGGSNPSLSASIIGLMALAPISSIISSNGELEESEPAHSIRLLSEEMATHLTFTQETVWMQE